MNGMRLAKKNSLAVKIMSAFAAAKILILILNNKNQKSLALLIVLFALFLVANIALNIINDRSELIKYTTISLYHLHGNFTHKGNMWNISHRTSY